MQRPAPVRVRVAGPEDGPTVESVLLGSYPALLAPWYAAELLDVVLPMLTRANPALLASGTFHLAVDEDGTAVGCGGWTFEEPGGQRSPAEPGLAHIRHFATRADSTRRGVGRALLQRCAEEASAGGVRRLEAMSSLPAEGFYAAFGFKPVERLSIRLRPDVLFPSVRMVFDLPSSP
jgi:N-acetylglutamate synthase-like GNAT family acetyltransferase